MVMPGAIALISPVLVGFLFGPEVLGGMLAGITVSGVLMGIFQNNAGGAWDNAKKSFEKGVEIDGEIYYKKSEPHKASVTGDTVGDPFKDTSGPSMNILIKLTSIVSLIIAPYIAVGNSNTTASDDCCKDKTEMTSAHEGCDSNSTCDMSECENMTLDQCMAKCDSLKCSPEERAKCMAMYDENGKFKKSEDKACCKDKK
jgi:K(+)-stimulated pyrophosphate-energized sodium pump